MSLVQKATDGLYKGVTRQEQSNRIDGQVEESTNMLHTVEKGVSRRNPTELIASLTGIPDDAFIYSYERGDSLEEYIIVMYNNVIRVFDTSGVEKTVNNSIGTSYLASTTPNNEFQAMTVGDTTFILNKSITVTMEATITGTLTGHKAHNLYWVKRTFDNGSGTGYDYKFHTYSKNGTKSTTVASEIASALGANYTAYGSVVYANVATELTWSDSYGNQASQGFHGTAKKITDLPSTLSGLENTVDIVMEITGDPDNQYTKYWAKFSEGQWKETVQGGLQNIIDATTMPHKLISEADGTFTFQLDEIVPRKVGDLDTAPNPSFVGNNISDMFFFKNRLCYLSGENTVMSETGEYGNFYPTTVTDVLDSDPIDVAVDSNTVSHLNNAVPFNDAVILGSSAGQFALKAEKVLSPNDVSISNTTAYNMVKNVRPIALGSSMYFLSESLNNTSLREYFVSDIDNSIAIDVSSHASGYIPISITTMVGNTNKDIILMHSTNSNTVYIYKFYSDGKERIQTALNKWVFGGTIKGITILNKYVYLLIDRGTGIQLERINYDIAPADTVYLDNGTIEYESSVQLSEPTLRDGNGKLLLNAGSPLMYKSLQLKSTLDSVYQFRIINKIRERIAGGFAVKDNKVLLQGKTNQVTIKIESVGSAPLEFHTYTTELLYNTRAQNI